MVTLFYLCKLVHQFIIVENKMLFVYCILEMHRETDIRITRQEARHLSL